jgi:hypothetical protein
MAHELSDYEKVRLANIQRNQDYLRSIGLDTVKQSINTENICQNAASIRQNGRSSSSSTSSSRIKPPKNQPSQPTRASSRVTRKSTTIYNGDKGNHIDDKHDDDYYDVGNEDNNIDDNEYDDLPLPIALNKRKYVEDENNEHRKNITAESLHSFISSKGYLNIDDFQNKDLVHCAYRMSYMSGI